MDQLLSIICPDMRISPTAYWLLKVLALMPPERLKDLSLETLAIEASMGYRSVIRYVKVLRAQNLIRCDRAGPGRGKAYTFEVLREGLKTDWAPLERVG